MRMKWLAKYSDYAYALLRIVTGLMSSFHGVQKILGVLTEMQPPVGSQLWIGGIIELFGGLAVVLGFQTRLAAFLCSGMMAVAYFQYHWSSRWDRCSFRQSIKARLAVLYCFVFLVIACRGGIKWCLDKKD